MLKLLIIHVVIFLNVLFQALNFGNVKKGGGELGEEWESEFDHSE